MHAMLQLPRRHRWLVFFLAALAIGLACGGKSWLLMVAAMFMLGRSYGSRAGTPEGGDGRAYGVGAALAGFTPARR